MQSRHPASGSILRVRRTGGEVHAWVPGSNQTLCGLALSRSRLGRYPHVDWDDVRPESGRHADAVRRVCPRCRAGGWPGPGPVLGATRGSGAIEASGRVVELSCLPGPETDVTRACRPARRNTLACRCPVDYGYREEQGAVNTVILWPGVAARRVPHERYRVPSARGSWAAIAMTNSTYSSPLMSSSPSRSS